MRCIAVGCKGKALPAKAQSECQIHYPNSGTASPSSVQVSSQLTKACAAWFDKRGLAAQPVKISRWGDGLIATAPVPVCLRHHTELGRGDA